MKKICYNLIFILFISLAHSTSGQEESWHENNKSIYTTQETSLHLIATSTQICVGESVTLTAQVRNGTPPYSYVWNEKLSTDSTYTVTPTETNQYEVIIFDSNQKRLKETITIEVSEYPEANFTYTLEPNNFTVTFTNTSKNNIVQNNIAVAFDWQFNHDGEKIPQSQSKKNTPLYYTYSDLTNYRVTLWAHNNFGCKDSISKTVSIYDVPFIEVPTAFSPNNDKNNDIIRAIGRNVENIEFIIYNRWGKELFRSDKLQYGWDGTYKGIDMPSGVYIYSIRATGIHSEKNINKTGNINLIR
ncbi:MAG: T9SS type B sorting domain-containing protein [Bacteroidota bacterium]